MRRLLLLAGALLLALLAITMAAGAVDDGLRAFVHVRDGFFVALISIALAAWASAAYPRAWNQTTWSTVARATIGAGIVTSLLAIGLRFVTLPSLPNLAEIVWGVGMLATFVGIALPPTIVRFAPPPFTWIKGSDGVLIRRASNPAGDPIGAQSTGRGWWLALLLVGILGALVRIWTLTNLPPVCRSTGAFDECAALLALAPDAAILPFASALVIPLARLLQAMGVWLSGTLAEPLWALRWAAVVVALLTLPALALALRPLVGVAGILLGVTFYALHPLFLELATDPAIEIVLWLLLVIAGGASALRSGNPRGWALAAVALGLLILIQPAWLLAWLIWLVVAIIVVLRPPYVSAIVPITLLVAGTVAGAALSSAAEVGAAWREASVWFAGGVTGLFSSLSDRISNTRAVAPAGSSWLLALALVGFGGAMRLRRVVVFLLAGTVALLLVASAQLTSLAATSSSSAARPLIIFAALFAAIAIDQLVRAVQRTWTPLVRPATWLAMAFVFVAALSGWSLYQYQSGQSKVTLPVDDQAALATIDFIQAARDDESLRDATWLLSPSLFAHGGIRSATNPERTAGRLLPFAAVADLPFTGEAPGGLVYILPASDPLTLETLQAVYPDGRALPLAAADGAEAIRVWRVDPATLFDSKGLAQFAYVGSEFGSADEAALSLGVGPLDFAWASSPPQEAPFSVEWSGSLLVRTPGETTFAVDAPPGATFSMTLDDRLVLDTSLGLVEYSEALPEGAQRIEMRYRSGDVPGDLTISWQPPGEESVPIPREALYNPAIPGMGLLGTYTAGSAWDGAAFAQRKDLQAIPDGTLELPWGVVWQGYLAAPRAGEYLLGAVTNGALLVDVDGKRLLTSMPEVLGSISPPTEGTIYLPQGWTPITIRFAPDAGNAQIAPEMRLYWQPPGGEPSPLRTTYFAPALTSGDGGEVTRPLPPLPPVDARLGNEDFALSADSSIWQPQERMAPTDLPLLPFENEAHWGSCGAGDGQLASPRGIAWDANGEPDGDLDDSTIYIADSGNARIVALNPVSGAMEVLPIADLEEPVDVALTPEGKLLILDTVAPKLVVYDPATLSAQTILLTGGFYRPRSIAVDGGGIIYIADTGGARVAALTPDGGLLTAFGGTETSLGKGQPAAVGVTSRALWTIAAEQGRLWHLNSLGSLTALQPTDTINGPHIATLRQPAQTATPGSAADVAASANATPASLVADSLFVTDPARQQVMWFAESGQPIGALNDEGAFDLPTGVAVVTENAATAETPDTLLAVADANKCEVSIWRALTPNLEVLLP